MSVHHLIDNRVFIVFYRERHLVAGRVLRRQVEDLTWNVIGASIDRIHRVDSASMDKINA